MYYGRFNPADDLSKMRSQILGHFGEKDASITIDSVKEFQAKLKTLSGSTSIVYTYPNAGNGFANEISATYDKDAAELAWKRTLEFLEKNVKNVK
jgi:carboxymethylenebutenolidase